MVGFFVVIFIEVQYLTLHMKNNLLLPGLLRYQENLL